MSKEAECALNKNKMIKSHYLSHDKEKIKLYKTYSNKLTKLKTISKKKFYADEFAKCKNDARNTWKILRNLLPCKHNSESKLPNFITTTSNEKFEEPQTIVNEFNKYFCSIGNSLAKKVTSTRVNSFKRFLSNRIVSSIFLEPTTHHEISSIIKDLCINKAMGHDNLHIFFIKAASTTLSHWFSIFFNFSLVHGVFPDNCKTAKVTPVHKSGDKATLNNYRPISILSSASKILEKLVHKRLTKFFDKHCILCPTQYGFRKNVSAEHALIDVITTSFDKINENQHSALLFLDLKKAFDTVNHDILLAKLDHYGIRGPAHDLLVSYLTDRKQFVEVASIKSEYKQITCGVPQGSILGPLLFNIYINDLHTSINSSVKLFADDACVTLNANNVASLQSAITQDLDAIKEWTASNKLTVNPNKSQLLVIPSKRNFEPINIDVHYNNCSILPENVVKYLGIFIDSDLNFHNHVKYIASKASRAIGVISKIKYLIPFKTLLSLYYSLIHPFLLYGLLAWGSSYKTYIDIFYKIQKKAIKILSGANLFDSSTKHFKKLGILKLQDLHKVEVGYLIKRYFNNNLPIEIMNFFTPTRSFSARTTRLTSQKFSLSIPRFKTVKLQHSLKYVGAKIWNSIPDEIKNLPKSTFKKKYKQYLLTKYTD